MAAARRAAKAAQAVARAATKSRKAGMGAARQARRAAQREAAQARLSAKHATAAWADDAGLSRVISQAKAQQAAAAPAAAPAASLPAVASLPAKASEAAQAVGRPAKLVAAGIGGLVGGYFAARHAGDVLGDAFLGDRPDGKPHTWGGLAGRALLSGYVPGLDMPSPDEPAFAIPALGMLGGLAAGVRLWRGVGGVTVDPADLPSQTAKGAAAWTDLKKQGALREAFRGKGGLLRAARLGAKRGFNRTALTAYSGGIPIAGAVASGFMGAALAQRTASRIAQAVIGQNPYAASLPYEARSSSRRSSPTGTRVARHAGGGDYSGYGATGDLVLRLHKTGGKGMVIT
jgi:hypothetical protein